MPDRSADVKFAIRAQGEFDPRIIRAYLHVAVIRHRHDGSHRPVAVDIDRHGLIVALHHHAKHTRRGHQPPHRRRADGRCAMNIRRALCHLRRFAHHHAHLTIHQRQANHFIPLMPFYHFFTHNKYLLPEALPLDSGRGAAPAPCKGVPPLTLSRD